MPSSRLQKIAHYWELFGQKDPMWAVLMVPERKGNLWDPLEFFETGFQDVTYALHMARNLEFPLRRHRALDFGCGVGRLTQGLACYFDEVDAIDIAPAMIRQARNYNPYGDRCQFHLNTTDDLSLLTDNSYDFILSLIVLQHMPPRFALRYIAEFMRVLAPGGLLLFQEPSHYSWRPVDEHYLPLATRVNRQLLSWLGRSVPCDPRLSDVPNHDLGDRAITTPKFPRQPPRLDGCHVRVDPAEKGLGVPPGSAQTADDDLLPETHAISRRKVVRHLRRLGGRVLNVAYRFECTRHHPSYRYYVTK